jgi:septum formation protein
VPFEVVPPGQVETELAARLGELHHDPAGYATILAEAKAKAVAAAMPGRLVLGADTVVVLGSEILEKPRDRQEACSMLGRLADQRHTVISALALVGGDAGPAGVSSWEVTEVEFLPLSPAVIEKYVATGEPMDKAGAYGIQGYGAMMVKGVQGCYFNVMGLPLARLGGLLRTVLA